MNTKWGGLLILCATLFVLSGCGDEDCARRGLCTGASGTGGGIDTRCVPSMLDAGETVPPDCGVFVSSSLGNDITGDGTQDAPYASVTKAITGNAIVYICAESYAEAVTLPSGATLFGGLDCAGGWTYTGAKPALQAPSNQVTLTLIAGAGESRIEDLLISGAAGTEFGRSSIALLAVNALATITRSEIRAGIGAHGLPGETPTGGDLGGVIGSPGVWVSNMTCSSASSSYTGGMSGSKICDGMNVAGGIGGQGSSATTGGPGAPGNGPDGARTGGSAGLGGTTCTPGGPGEPGSNGFGGMGATGVGTLDENGYLGVTGEPGTGVGEPGEGGGGGGGAEECQPTSNFAGPSGGGGGSGACGGQPGGGGGPAGASISIASVRSTLTLNEVQLSSHDGGTGGGGSNGQPGGQGGQGGPPGGAGACAGGDGGDGGNGGAGGGGLGGHSLGIAYVGDGPAQNNVTFAIGTAGDGGVGGDGGSFNQGTDGQAGRRCEVMSFDTFECIEPSA